MRDEQPVFGTPEDWIRYAESDLELAKVPRGGKILVETLVFRTQQVVEKSLKAVLLASNIPFPYSHNLDRLMGLIPPGVAHNLPETDFFPELMEYLSQLRYPGPMRFLNDEDLAKAITVAERVLQWAREAIVQGKSGKAARG